MNKAEVIAVTGSKGFIGHHLVDKLRKTEHKLLEIDIAAGTDILSIDDMNKLPPFGVMVHLAAKTFVPESYIESRGFYQTNIMGTINCLELCKKNNANMIFASTYVYGKPKYLPIDERHPIDTWNPYATSKIVGEHLCEAYSRDFSVNCHILRIFNIYGQGQDKRFLVPTIIDGVIKGKLKLENATSKRDFVYYLDVLNALILCIYSKNSGCFVYNVGSGKSSSVEQVVDIVMSIMNRDVEVEYGNIVRKSEVHNVVADISKIESAMGWVPEYSLEDGLNMQIDSYIAKNQIDS
ncbi:NAD-dependent epimerase/dehydratase family protein [Acidobacteriota bacterium]